MAETTKKKRGRPPKKKPEVDINEQKESVRMNQPVSIGDVGKRMKEVFGKMYLNNVLTNFQTAINRTPFEYSNMFMNNPYIQNQRIKKINSPINLATKKDIQEALAHPGDNESRIRSSSMALYYNNYVYQNLVKLNRDIPQYFHYSIPVGVDDKTLSSDEFKKEKQFVDKFLQVFDLPETFKNISLQVAREGKCSYLFRDSHDTSKKIVDFALLQKLPSEYIKYTAFGSESPLITSFNFMYFVNPMNSINDYPAWFKTIWDQLQETGIVNITKDNGYKINPAIQPGSKIPGYIFENIAGTYYLYVELPQDLCWVFGTDFADPFAIPDYAGLFADLTELEAYKVLQSQTLVTNITNVLTAEVPVQKDATAESDAAILSPEVIMGLEYDCSSALSQNILPFFAPLQNFKMHSVEHIPQATSIVLDVTRNIMSTAGTSGLINTNEKPSIAMIKGEQMLHESRSEYLTLQYQKFINLVLNRYLDLKYEYKVVIWGGIYTYRDEVKMLKEMIQNGNIGMLPRLLSAFRMTLEDYAVQYKYTKSLGIIPEPEQKSNTTQKKPVGRPKLEDNDVTDDNTAASIEGGSNVSENK